MALYFIKVTDQIGEPMNKTEADGCSLFVSYAHEDHKFVEGLRKPFIALEHSIGHKFYWDDTSIRSGQEWNQQIVSALEQARIAVLLVSPDFLASEFIREEELPRLLKRHRAGQISILPVCVGPIDVDTAGLGHIQFVNSPDQPLKGLATVQRESCYLKVATLAKELLTASESLGAGQDLPYAPDPNEAVVPNTLEQALTWNVTAPQAIGAEEIEHSLRRIRTHTRSRGFVAFSMDEYYVQFAYYPKLNGSFIVMEAISNAYLRDRPLSDVQIRYLTDDLQFSQPSDDDNFTKLVRQDSQETLKQLVQDTWRILTDVYNTRQESLLIVDAHCA